MPHRAKSLHATRQHGKQGSSASYRAPGEQEQQEHGAVGLMSPDEQVQQDVLAALIENPMLEATAIVVTVAHQEVLLAGDARSDRERNLATRLAREKSRDYAVRNEITVKRKPN